MPMHLSRVADSAERIVYRIAGLPVAIWAYWATFGGSDDDPLQAALASTYWHPDGSADWSELLGGLVAWPLAILLAIAWYTYRNGRVIRRRHGKSLSAQAAEQLRLYFSAGILPPSYYIFSLHDEGPTRATTFIQRFESKRCLFPLLKPRKGSPLNDKGRFAEHCREHGLRCVVTLMRLDGQHPQRPLPDEDLFVKPARGRGGRGAERWDLVAAGQFTSRCGDVLSGDDLLRRLVRRSRREPLVIQPRLHAHAHLREITTGALPTVRLLTCLDQDGAPEVMAAMLRMSRGASRTVDNMHAGGIGALVDLDSGALSKSSDLGSDARLGWFSAHPDTGAAIEGRVVPCWNECKALALAAHREFNDRTVIGWDIAVVQDGPMLVEGNGNPDLDILQRFMRTGLRDQRFGKLVAFHLQQRLGSAAGRLPAEAIAP